MKLDIASFFASIDKAILYEVIAAAIRDPEVRWLTRVILFHDPTTNYCFRALRPGMEECVPLGRGVDFVGWRTWWNRRLVRRQVRGANGAPRRFAEHALVCHW